LLSELGAVIIPKPAVSDFEQMAEGGTVWGWAHCVQQRAVTQAAIDRRLSVVTFEGMFAWGPDGHRGLHTFYKNNEMAGYCAALHSLQLRGMDGYYGDRRKVVILSFGAVSRGAIHALQARGFSDITICVHRPDYLVREEVLGCHYLRMREGEEGEPRLVAIEHSGAKRPLSELLSEADIIVNGVLQDPENPLMFVVGNELSELKPGCLIIDVSCDEGMGFDFAKPTSFEHPTFEVGHVTYYAVDHTPTYLWASASWEISAALLQYVPIILAGPEAWRGNETIRHALEIEAGVVRNPTVLSFQKRQAEYPHAPLDSR
jgi:alanine dehydrogenase